jgi:hypothetical protein
LFRVAGTEAIRIADRSNETHLFLFASGGLAVPGDRRMIAAFLHKRGI